jgi:RNA polymerase sigma-70 factor (ECF subfamily)
LQGAPQSLPPFPRSAPTPLGDGEGDARGEGDLVARAKTDPEAFAQLYRRHHPAIARYVRRRVGADETARDLVAETFLAALESLPRYRDRGLPFRAWLYRLATSRVNRWARRRGRLVVLGFEREPLSREDEGGPLAGAAVARAALLSLPPRYQTVLALHHLEGLSVEEVAAALGCRSGTVKARLSRGRERLRRRLAPREEELFQ